MRAIALAALVAGIGAALTGGGWAEEAFVTNQLSENLTVVDLTSLQPVATIAIGGKPAGVAISPDGRFAYVTSPDAKALTVVDAADITYSSIDSAAEGQPLCMLGLKVHLLVAGATFNLHSRVASARALRTSPE